MNKIFKVIWNNAKRCYVVASELAKSHSKSKSSRTIRKSIAALGIAVAFYIAAGSAIAANDGGSLDQNTGDYIGLPNFTVTIDSDVTGNV
ncbi:MAG: ESPR domain-containing protein [Candidatus Riflebacteria bacterium]|nr:ESPR domain-containing protein [Candidatus Riflebacteria bacterium]MBR4569163.1 ESPR domain-containing protein [Candidatus Riflebacteria bacterium]